MQVSLGASSTTLMSLLFVLAASSLGQLVRPTMGVSPVLTQGPVARVRQVPAPPLPPAQLGTGPKQLSAPLGMCSSAPESGQRQQPCVVTNKRVGPLTSIWLYFSPRPDDPAGWTGPADVAGLPRLLRRFSPWRREKGFAQQYESCVHLVPWQPSKCLQLYCCLCVVIT